MEEGQANKGAWRMPRHQEAKKDVAGYEKRRGAAKQALNRRYPNGATPPVVARPTGEPSMNT